MSKVITFLLGGQSMNDAGINEHPSKWIQSLSEQIGFQVLEMIPRTLFDGWEITVKANVQQRQQLAGCIPFAVFREGEEGWLPGWRKP